MDLLVTKAKSNFMTLKMAIPLDNIPHDSLKYVVLFQELFFGSPVKMKYSEEIYGLESIGHDLPDDQEGVLDYQMVVRLLSQDLVHHEIGVGVVNEILGCSWLTTG